MKHYTVTLTYEGDAESPEEAAEDFLAWVDMQTAIDVLPFVKEAGEAPEYEQLRLPGVDDWDQYLVDNAVERDPALAAEVWTEVEDEYVEEDQFREDR